MANEGMTVSELTEGVSLNGAHEYYEMLKTSAIDETAKLLLETKEVKNAIQAGWQGRSSENFQKSFDNITEATAKQIKAMNNMLQSELSMVTQAWVDQDNKMVEESETGVMTELRDYFDGMR